MLRNVCASSVDAVRRRRGSAEKRLSPPSTSASATSSSFSSNTRPHVLPSSGASEPPSPRIALSTPVPSTKTTATIDVRDRCWPMRISAPRATDDPSAGSTASPPASTRPPQTAVASRCSVCTPTAADSTPLSAAWPSDALPAATTITASHSTACASGPSGFASATIASTTAPANATLHAKPVCVCISMTGIAANAPPSPAPLIVAAS